MTQRPFMSRVLTVDVVASARSVDLVYGADSRAEAVLRVEYPDEIAAIPTVALDLLAAVGAIYLGSLCLAREIRIRRPLNPRLLADLGPIIEMLYDIRRWKDELPLGPAPELHAPESRGVGLDDRPLDERSAVALWSGGKDSTLAVLTLQANHYDVHPVHVTANVGVEAFEEEAVGRLSKAIDERVATIRLIHDDFLEFSNAYAREWDDFPLCNRVPFGRDLLLPAVAIPFALSLAAGCISLGHDNECRKAEVVVQGKRIPRNDLESIRGAVAFERVLQQHVNPLVRLLPPVAKLSELRILRDMFVGYPELMAMTSFCFWGENCGRCAKCLRYYLADRVYGQGQLRFAVDPLSAGACPELAEFLSPLPRSTLFQKEVQVLLGRLAQRSKPRETQGSELDRFRATRLAAVEPSLDEWEAELLLEQSDPQVPPDFRPAVAHAIEIGN